jgi:hypothetical protein
LFNGVLSEAHGFPANVKEHTGAIQPKLAKRQSLLFGSGFRMG